MENFLVQKFLQVVIWNESLHKILKKVVALLNHVIFCDNNSKIYVLVKLLEVLKAIIFSLKAEVILSDLVNQILL